MLIGVDLGGTKIEAAALDGAGRIVARLRCATPQGDYDATLAAVAELLGSLDRSLDGVKRPIGVAIPGALSPFTGRVVNANSTWLIGRPLDRDLTERLDRPVRLANDANCFALSEAVDGAAAGLHVVFGVILGTGVGGGITIAGHALTGRHAIAGEWGHNPIPLAPDDEAERGRPCYCGRQDCIETWLSGPALAREAGCESAQQVADRAAAGEPGAAAAVARYEARLALALAGVVNLLDPDAIVLGGGLSNLDRLYRSLPQLMSAEVFSERFETPILRPRFGDSSGVRGAAWLWRGEEAGE